MHQTLGHPSTLKNSNGPKNTDRHARSGSGGPDYPSSPTD
jgi:hypothetical protein